MLTIINEHKFIKKDDLFYTTGTYNKNNISRYTSNFGNVKFVSRVINSEKNIENFYLASGKNVSFSEIVDLTKKPTIKNFFNMIKTIKKEVINSEYLLLRTGVFANIAAHYAVKFNKPYIVEVVNCAWDSFWNYSFLTRFIAPFMFYFQKRTVKKASHAIYVTEKFLQKRYPNNNVTTAISNVEIKEVKLNYKPFDMKKNIFSIATIGNVDVKFKGQEFVIKAIDLINRKTNYKFKYFLIGGGNPSRLIKKIKNLKLEDQIVFLGKLNHDEVIKKLDEVDFYIQPSKQEGLPRALIEAMSRGNICFGSMIAGIPELLEEDELINTHGNFSMSIAIKLIESFNRDTEIIKQNNIKKSMKYLSSRLESKRKQIFDNYKNLIDRG
jgi:glycosyltransferase involved in cell wall biosynthesis